MQKLVSLFVAFMLIGTGLRAETLAVSMGGALVCAAHGGEVRCWGTTSNGGLGSAGLNETNVSRTVR